MAPPKTRIHNLEQKKTATEKNNTENQPPSFSFRYLVKHTDFCYDSLNKTHKVALIDTLYRLSQLTWSVLRSTHCHGLGFEKIERNALNFSLPNEVPNDYNIIAFRFCGKAPMLGYRSSDGIFYIIAFDSKFKAYKH